MKATVPLAALLIAAVALLAWASFADAPWEDDGSTVALPPSPTPYQQQLTGAEAAALVEMRVKNAQLRDILEDPVNSIQPFKIESCEAQDFNTSNSEWIVRCSMLAWNPLRQEYVSDNAVTYRVEDATGDHEPVR